MTNFRKYYFGALALTILSVTSCSNYKDRTLDGFKVGEEFQLSVGMTVNHGPNDNDEQVFADAGVAYFSTDPEQYSIIKNLQFINHLGEVEFECSNQRINMERYGQKDSGNFAAGYLFDSKDITYGDLTAEGLIVLYDSKNQILHRFDFKDKINHRTIKKNSWVSQF